MSTRFCTGCTRTPISARNTTGLCHRCNIQRLAARHRQAPSAGMQQTGDKAEVATTTDTPVRTLEDLIRVCQIDTTTWTVDRWVANKWESGPLPQYQVKAWLTRNVGTLRAAEQIRQLVADAKARIPARPTIKRRPLSGVGHMLELSIPDLHLGKLAWAPETGYQDYDLKIAEGLFHEAVDTLVAQTRTFPLARVVLPIGNDLLHADNKLGATTKGTPLDMDTRYHKMFSTARRMLTTAIDRLRTLAPVTVVVVPGNHDTLGAFHLGDSLECFYHATADVEVLNAPTPRKYLGFGRIAIMYTHGHTGKPSDWPLLFATEQPELFGGALVREIHSGHLHTTRLMEHHGVRVRISPALCSPDAWHSEHQFVGHLRGAEAYVWHPERGLVAMSFFAPGEPLDTSSARRIA